MKAKIGTIGEITGRIKAINRKGNSLIGIMLVGGQIPYDIEATISRSDIRRILRLILKPSIIWYALTSLVMVKEPEPLPEEPEEIDW